jgi:hypothetical protein
MARIKTDGDWKFLLHFLPEGWEEKAKELGAVTRQRKIVSPEILLRVLLIHLADSCSMRETVVRARESGLTDISDVALFKRLKASSEWLRWIAVNLAEDVHGISKKPDWLKAFNVRIVDASTITEPGSTGSDWRLHFSIELFGLTCDHFRITGPKVGETFRNFPIKKGDLIIGDRGYGSAAGITYVIENEGDFLVRIKNRALKLMRNEKEEFGLLENFQKLDYGEIGDFDVFYRSSDNRLRYLRLCAIKKSPEAAEKSRKNAIQLMSKKQRSLSEETIELHDYVFVITSVRKDVLSASEIMLLYRMRWQVELAFKRLKSILGLGHLPKFDPDSSKAWLHGKRVVALLTNAIVDRGRSFSPWGYPLRQIL